MSRIRLRYIQAFVDRKTSVTFHYFRRAGFPLVRLPGLLGSEQFMAAYQQALAAAPEPVGSSRSKITRRAGLPGRAARGSAWGAARTIETPG
jgi:hypothetical protein